MKQRQRKGIALFHQLRLQRGAVAQVAAVQHQIHLLLLCVAEDLLQPLRGVVIVAVRIVQIGKDTHLDLVHYAVPFYSLAAYACGLFCRFFRSTKMRITTTAPAASTPPAISSHPHPGK